MGTRKVGAAVAAIALVFVGCSRAPRDSAGDPDATGSPRPRGSVPAPLVHAASLESFDACPDLLGYLRQESTKRVGPYGLPGGGGVHTSFTTTGDAVAMAADSGSAERAAAPAETSGYSGTNVQERSVDEPDAVKTDGRHIFTTRPDGDRGRVSLVAASVEGGRPSIAGDVRLPEGAGTELLLAGDRLLVFGGGMFAMPMDGRVGADMGYPGGGAVRTIVSVVDVRDPAKMRVTDVVRLEGSYTSARMVGGIARLVLNTSSQERLDFEPPAEPTVTAEKQALAHNRRIARTAKIEDWLPRFKVEDADGNKRSEGPLVGCSSTYRPTTFSGFQTTTVVTIDPAKPQPRESAAVVGGAGTVYASERNLYVATQHWPEPRPLVIEDRPIGVPDIAPADPAKTLLHRFDISDRAQARYAASGEVRGTVLNQWSLSEHDGHLRVATTEDNFTRRENASRSFVTTFDATAPKLNQVGQIGNLGVGERIYGVRFIGDLGYVVTFRQIDPLHVIDLSTPSKPRLLGELKIPGYSAYLHPVGDGLLLGVGQDADPEEGRPLGTQLSLFDVRDPTDPKRIDQLRLDGASSPIEWDHHAFTWWEPARLAIVPVSRHGGGVEPVAEEGARPRPVETLEAAIGYRIGDRDIREVGRASHARHAEGDVNGQISRSIVIGDAIYTLSGAGIMSSDLRSFAERGWAAF